MRAHLVAPMVAMLGSLLVEAKAAVTGMMTDAATADLMVGLMVDMLVAVKVGLRDAHLRESKAEQKAVHLVSIAVEVKVVKMAVC